jgi:uncharacterized membrane protein
MPRFVHLAAAIALSSAGLANAQVSFTVLPSSTGLFARTISGNGQVIGGSTGTFVQERPYIWRQVAGTWTRFDLPGEGGLNWGRVVALSFDGDTAAGSTNYYVQNSAAGGTPAVWRSVLSGTPTVQSPLDDSGLATARRGAFCGVSSDGSRVVGFAVPISPQGLLEDYYLATTSNTSIISPVTGGYRSAFLFGNAMSADGNSAVGLLRSSSVANNRAVLWTQAAGWTELASPTTGGYVNAYDECISANGLVSGGFLASTNNAYNLDGRPCIWTGTVRTDLATVTPNLNGRVTALSGDGSIAVGVQHVGLVPVEELSGNAWSAANAVIWVNTQPFLLSNYLTSRGANLGDVTPRWATGISADGSTIVGIGSQASTGRLVSFVAVVPEPAAGVLLIAGLAFRRRRGNRM